MCLSPIRGERIWSTSERVGVSGVEAHPGGRERTVLIKKDFRCLKPRQGEGEEDAFPTPPPNKTAAEFLSGRLKMAKIEA